MTTLSASLLKKIEKNGRFDTVIADKKTPRQIKDLEYNKIGFYRTPENVKNPEEFDGKEVWKEYLTSVFNQGTCGSCWAFATASTYADRFNIITQNLFGKGKITLSPTKLLICDTRGSEDVFPYYKRGINLKKSTPICKGSTLTSAWQYVYLSGLCTDFCTPYDYDFADQRKKISNISQYGQELTQENDYMSYSLTKHSTKKRVPNCEFVMGKYHDTCIDTRLSQDLVQIVQGVPAQFFRCSFYYKVKGGEKAIRNEIYKWGPVSTGIQVFADFYDFDPKTDIYIPQKDQESIGGHAIEIVGWGTEKGTKFWWIKNSWGEKWGISGYFKMIRGINACHIEENIIVGIPDFFNLGYVFQKKVHKGLQINGIETNQFGHEIQQKRYEIDFGFHKKDTITAGGIDPYTGYTRRTMTLYTGHNFSPPITIEKLKEKLGQNIFIAGHIKSHLPEKTTITLQNTKPKPTTSNKNNNVIIICSVLGGIIIISIIIYIFIKK